MREQVHPSLRRVDHEDFDSKFFFNKPLKPMSVTRPVTTDKSEGWFEYKNYDGVDNRGFHLDTLETI